MKKDYKFFNKITSYEEKKLILDIEPLFEGISFNCISDQILSYTRWLGRRHELSYSETWRFRFRSFEEDIPSGFDNFNTNQYILLEKYHGIRMVKHDLTAPEEMYSLLEQELCLNRPLMIFVDSFWLPWDVCYQINHTQGHFFWAVGYDKEDGEIYCSDGSSSAKGILPKENYINGFKPTCYTFPVIGKDNSNKVDWRDIIKSNLEELVNDTHDSFHEIVVFAQKLREFVYQMNVENEKACYDKLYDMCIGLDYASINRKLYAILLNYLAEQKNDLLDISQEITMSAYKWAQTRHLVLKGLAAHNLKNVIEKIYIRITNIAAEEKRIANKLKELYQDADSILSVKTDAEPAIGNAVSEKEFVQPIEIALYYNNKGLSYDFYKGSANLTGLGNYIQFEEHIGGRLITSNQMSFRLPIIADDKNDNISCLGQIIDIPRGKYIGIQLLGCADWGEHVENLILYYEDGKMDSITFGFADYYKFDTWNKTLNFNQKIVLRARPVECKSGTARYMDRDANIYGSSFYFNRKGAFINRIKLPDCPNIHLFSLSLIMILSDR